MASRCPRPDSSSAPSCEATRRAPPSPRPQSSPRSRATASCAAWRSATRAGSSPPTSATRPRSTGRRSSASASRRCTGSRSSRWPTSSSRSDESLGERARADVFEGLLKAYYDKRAPEYDQWYEATGAFAARDRPGWVEDRQALVAGLPALPPARTLDVACGTGYLTRHLRGAVTGLDQSEAMIAIASERMPDARFVVGDAIPLPFADGEFSRVFTGHFYGHLEEPARTEFLAEARRVASRELVVVDSARRADVPAHRMDERVLNDGSRHEVFKRWFVAEELAEELGGGEVLHAGPWFVAVRSPG